MIGWLDNREMLKEEVKNKGRMSNRCMTAVLRKRVLCAHCGSNGVFLLRS